MSDWKFDSKSRDAESAGEAWGTDPDGVVINLNIHASGTAFAHISSSDAENGTPSNYQAASSATAHATDIAHLVSAKTRLGGLALATTQGYGAGTKASSGAKMVHHYEANKAGRAKGTMKLTASLSGPFSELPGDTITVTAGNSSISASYQVGYGWSIYGTLRTATGVRQINQQQQGFGNLDVEFAFDEAIGNGDDFTIVADVNGGSPGDNLEVRTVGNLTECDLEMHGYVILDSEIGPDH